MDLRWTKHLKTEEDKKNFEKMVRNDTQVLGRVDDLLNEELASIDRREVREDDFATANWAERQAFRNGRRSQLVDLKTLLAFINKPK